MIIIYCKCQCLVNVMRTSDEKPKTDGTSSSSSSLIPSVVVEKNDTQENLLLNNNKNNDIDDDNIKKNETVMVNNCVNIDYLNANLVNTTSTTSENSAKIEENLVANNNNNNNINDDAKQQPDALSKIVPPNSSPKCDDVSIASHGSADEKIDAKDSLLENKNNNDENIESSNNNDNDDDTSSKYSKNVSYSRCEMLQPCCSTSTNSLLLPHAAAHNQYTPNRDNNRNHRRAVRKNFSLWIGVTSCVWACLVWLMKNYAN